MDVRHQLAVLCLDIERQHGVDTGVISVRETFSTIYFPALPGRMPRLLYVAVIDIAIDLWHVVQPVRLSLLDLTSTSLTTSSASRSSWPGL